MNNIGLASSPQLQPMGTVAHYVLASQNGRADRACGPARRPSWFVATARGVCALGVVITPGGRDWHGDRRCCGGRIAVRSSPRARGRQRGWCWASSGRWDPSRRRGIGEMTVPLGGGGVRRWWRCSVGRRLALTVPAAPEWRGGGG
jgi:hypothetical protein